MTTRVAVAGLLSAAASIVFYLQDKPEAHMSASAIVGHYQIFRESAAKRVEPGGATELFDNDEVRVPAGSRAQLTTPSGARAALSSNSGMVVLSSDRQELLQLRRGSVRLRVPKLPKDKTLSVVTEQATVVVVGTDFSVTIDELTKQTCVRVTEGRVSVRSQEGVAWLPAGGAWGCTEAAPPVQPVSISEPTRTRRNVTSNAPAHKEVGQRAAETENPQAIQNRLFQRALRSKRSGKVLQARRSFAELLARYPDSSFAPEAKRQLAELRQHPGRRSDSEPEP